jgi:Gas vesicle protein
VTWPAGPGEPQLALGASSAVAASTPVRYSENVALVDLLDRVLAGGVVIAGDVTLSIAGVDLVAISLRALIASAAALASSSSGPMESAHGAA